MGDTRIGVDFGGTKIEAAALDRSGQILDRRRTPTPRSYDDALAAVRDLVAAVEAHAGAGSVGVGAPGSISPTTGLIRNANTTYLNGRPFERDLASALNRDVRVANDANCLALSEAVDGAAAGAPVVFAVIIGTGCGGGVAIGGRVIAGANGNTGEWGHTPLPSPNTDELPPPLCWCGQAGCMETWVSGPGFAQSYTRLTGRTRAPADILAAADAGEAEAQRARGAYVDRLGRGLANIVNILDPDAIVLGGGMSNITGLPEALAEAIRPRVFSDAWSCRIVQARWGDSSGVRGAAWLWND